jgi:hypothetical protein
MIRSLLRRSDLGRWRSMASCRPTLLLRSLRLSLTVAPILTAWVERHFLERKDKVLGRIRSIRGGKLNDPRFGSRMRGEGIFANQISQVFHVACRKVGLPEDGPELSTAAFRRPEGAQLGRSSSSRPGETGVDVRFWQSWRSAPPHLPGLFAGRWRACS